MIALRRLGASFFEVPLALLPAPLPAFEARLLAQATTGPYEDTLVPIVQERGAALRFVVIAVESSLYTPLAPYEAELPTGTVTGTLELLNESGNSVYSDTFIIN